MSTPIDNDSFRDYLKGEFDCTFFQSFAQTKDSIYIDSFNNTFREESNIYIHFKSFEWTPIFKQTSTKDKWYYIENKSTAPIIEFSKTDWKTHKNGRLYWEKYFSGNPEYNVVEFESVYNAIVKWVKQNSGGHLKVYGSNVYFFKDAWASQENEL